MSEVERHYGGDALGDDRLRGRGAQARPEREDTARSLRDAGAYASEARDRVAEEAGERLALAREWLDESYDTVSRNAVYARRRSAAEFNRGRRQVEEFVEENPIMVGVAGLAVGLLIGSLLPNTRRENEVLGPYADDVREQGMRYARTVAEQGREALAENLRSVRGGREGDPA